MIDERRSSLKYKPRGSGAFLYIGSISLYNLLMLYIGLFVILLSFLIAYKFVDINVISEKDSDKARQFKRRTAACIVFVIGIVLVLLDII